MYVMIKIVLSAFVIVAASEIAKRSSVFGALIASLPLTSMLAIVWLYEDTKDVGQVAAFSNDILWLVVPSLILFIALPLLLKRGVSFYAALGAASLCTAFGYLAMTMVVRRLTQVGGPS
jgi:hypothetical protein